MKKIYILFSLFFLVLRVHGQCPGPAQRTALLNLQKAGIIESSRAGQIPLTDACGNLRYAQYTEIDLVPISYTPSSTGNTQNYSEFVTTASGDIWYLDWQGRGIKLWNNSGGGGSNDYDWLTISDNTIPDNIADSIYTGKYASVNMRRVWPNAQMLVGDSTGTNGASGIVAGDRSARWGFVRMLDESWSSIGQEGNANAIRLGPGTTAFKISVAAGPSPSEAIAPFRDVASFRTDSLIRFNDYPNSRNDTATAVNFFYSDAQGYLKSGSLNNISDNVITIEKYGGIADFRRISGLSVIKDTKSVTCSSCFSSSDVGKIITVPFTRIDTAYNVTRRVTMNTKIVTFVNPSTVTVDSLFDVSTSNVSGYIGTNNADAFKAALNVATTSNKKFILLSAGTYLIVPTKATIPFYNIPISTGIYIKGQGTNTTKLKIGEEFTQTVAYPSPKSSDGFFISGSGHRIFEDFTLEAADTASTQYVTPGIGFKTEEISNLIADIEIRNVNIKNFGIGYFSSGGGVSGNWFNCLMENDTIEGYSGAVYQYGSAGYSRLHMNECITKGGGQAAGFTWNNSVNTTAGSKTISVTIPGFSFYDLAGDNNPRAWNVWVNDVLYGRITNIINRTTAVVTNTIPTTITNGKIRVDYNTDGLYGHILYIHPTVNLEVRNCDFYNGTDLIVYSSSLQIGVSNYIRFIGCQTKAKNIVTITVQTTNLIPWASGGHLLLENCPRFSTSSALSKVVVKGLTFNGIIIGDTARVENCRFLSHYSGTMTIQSNGFVEIYDLTSSLLSLSGTGRININNSVLHSSGVYINTLAYAFFTNCNISGVSTFISGANLANVYRVSFDGCAFGKNLFVNNTRFAPWGINNGYTTTQLSTYRNIFSFKNCAFDGYLFNWQASPSGFFPISTGTDHNNTILGNFNIAGGFDTIRIVGVPFCSEFRINTKNDINFLGFGRGNAGLYEDFLYATHFFQGTVRVVCQDSFNLKPGINIRLLKSQKRQIGELIEFTVDGETGIFYEKNSSIANEAVIKPVRSGLIGEIVKRKGGAGDGWVYSATISSTSKIKSLVGLSLPIRDTVPHQITVGYEFSSYAKPDTMMSINVSTSIGSETFKLNKFGQLIGSNGGTGDFNYRTRQYRINTLGGGATINTAGQTTIFYKYVTSGSWQYFDDRKIKSNFVLDFPSTSPLTSVTLTQSVIGVTTQDAVTLQPVGGVPSNSIYTAWASAPDTVTVSFTNLNGVAIDPPSATYNVVITKY